MCRPVHLIHTLHRRNVNPIPEVQAPLPASAAAVALASCAAAASAALAWKSCCRRSCASAAASASDLQASPAQASGHARQLSLTPARARAARSPGKERGLDSKCLHGTLSHEQRQLTTAATAGHIGLQLLLPLQPCLGRLLPRSGRCVLASLQAWYMLVRSRVLPGFLLQSYCMCGSRIGSATSSQCMPMPDAEHFKLQHGYLQLLRHGTGSLRQPLSVVGVHGVRSRDLRPGSLERCLHLGAVLAHKLLQQPDYGG